MDLLDVLKDHTVGGTKDPKRTMIWYFPAKGDRSRYLPLIASMVQKLETEGIRTANRLTPYASIFRVEYERRTVWERK